MNELNGVSKAILAVAIAATVILISVVILFLAVRVTEAENRALKAEETLTELTTQNRGPQGPEGDPGRAPTQEEIAAAVADYCAERNSCRGEPGAAGAPGKNGQDGKSIQGPQGAPGANGANAQGITRVQCLGTAIRFWSGPIHVGDVAMVCLP